jgi:succinyl-diaminopimelate desuccinylase
VISTKDTLHPKIILNGHLDVVPADYENAFTPIEKDGKIFARGTSDMKGTVSAMVYAFKDLLDDSTNLDLALMLTTDEEIGGFNGVKKLIEEVGYSADCVFTPDSAENWGICTDEKGIWHISVRTTGKSSHGSRPWLGENAIESAYSIFQECKDMLQRKYASLQREDHWFPTINLGVLNGGDATNKVPASAIIKLDIRYPSPITDTELKQFVLPIVKKHNGEIIEELIGNSLHTNKNNEYIQSWVSVLRKHDIKPYWHKGHGASDARYFSENGIPVFLSKPVASEPHIDNEWIDYDSLVEFKEMLKHWLKTVA